MATAAVVSVWRELTPDHFSDNCGYRLVQTRQPVPTISENMHAARNTKVPNKRGPEAPLQLGQRLLR